MFRSGPNIPIKFLAALIVDTLISFTFQEVCPPPPPPNLYRAQARRHRVLKLSSEPLLHHMEMKNFCASAPFGAQTWSLARPSPWLLSLCFRALHIFRGDANAVCAFLGPGSHIEVKHVLPNVPKLPSLDRNNCSCLAEALKHVDAHMSLQNMLVYFLTNEAHQKHI